MLISKPIHSPPDDFSRVYTSVIFPPGARQSRGRQLCPIHSQIVHQTTCEFVNQFVQFAKTDPVS
jgi:hypothetical protein